MAKQPSLNINGYKIPGARGGAAVLKACQMVRQNPGIKQSDLIDHVTVWANLNLSTAGWITSPGPKSPAGILWDRRKEGRGFKCYPNEHTTDIDPRLRLRDIVCKEFDMLWEVAGRPVAGDLVSVTGYNGSVETGLLTHYGLWQKYTSLYRSINTRSEIDDINMYDTGDFRAMPSVFMNGRKSDVPFTHIRKIS